MRVRAWTCCQRHKDEGEGEGGQWHVMTRVTTMMMLLLLLCCQTYEEESQDKEVLSDALG